MENPDNNINKFLSEGLIYLGEVILEMKNIKKSFSGVPALKSAALEVKEGEVHALMGENGAGKSTLMKILCGIYRADSGSITYFGSERRFENISQSQQAGICVIHQELNMLSHLTVAQNIYIGREPKKGIFIDDKKMENDALLLFKKMGVDIRPSAKLGTLTVGKQQMVEIAKAISHESRLLILDEPTAALSERESEELFKIMNELRTKGIGMVYISHRMNEIKRISDRVTVMRDGEYIGTVNTNETTQEEIVKMMVGREIGNINKTKSNVKIDAKTVLEVKNIKNNTSVHGVSFKLRRGEILGISGLMGAGRTELARLIYGAEKKTDGEVYINGVKKDIRTPEEAVSAGICYLSEDRKRYGLLVQKNVAENTSLSSIDKYIQNGFIDDKRIYQDSAWINGELRTKCASVTQTVRELSGGNQQKIVISKWLLRDADIFIFDEPTRGIDIGAKSEIYTLMEKLAAAGKSVIMISSELAEILRLSDRILVMCEGYITGELDIESATQEKIMQLATQRKVSEERKNEKKFRA